MRTFISIDMPEVVRSEIEKIQDVLPEFFGKKTERDNLHLTLKFLGEIDEEKVKEFEKNQNVWSFGVRHPGTSLFTFSERLTNQL